MIVTVPASLADAGAPARARLLLVLDALRCERMSPSAAARALGVALDHFLDLAREHGVPVVRYDASDLADDLAALAKLEQIPSVGE